MQPAPEAPPKKGKENKRAEKPVEDTEPAKELKRKAPGQGAAAQEPPQSAEQKLEGVASLSTSLLQNPEQNAGSLRSLLRLVADPDPLVARAATISTMLVFRDLAPGYRIRPPTDKELEVTVSKEVQQLRKYEAAFLGGARRIAAKTPWDAAPLDRRLGGALQRRSRLPLGRPQSPLVLLTCLDSFVVPRSVRAGPRRRLAVPSPQVAGPPAPPLSDPRAPTHPHIHPTPQRTNPSSRSSSPPRAPSGVRRRRLRATARAFPTGTLRCAPSAGSSRACTTSTSRAIC